MNISKKELLKTLIDMSPFFIDEVIHRLNPTPTEKERIQLQRRIFDMNLDEQLKMKLIRACGEYEFRLVEGSNEFIQLSALLAEIANLSS